MIKAITLHSLKAFEDQRIPFGGLTLLCGLNSSGKSTVLQTLGLLRQSVDAGMLNGDGLLLNGEILEIGTARDLLHEAGESDRVGIDLECDDRSFSWTVDASCAGADVLPILQSPSILPAHPLFGISRLQHEVTAGLGPHFQFVRADRLNPAVYYPKSYRAAVRDRFIGSRGEYTAHFLNAHRDATVLHTLRRVPGGATPGLLSQVSAWMQGFSPGVRVEVADIPNTDFVRLQFAFGSSAGLSGTIDYRPTNVGFGLSYVLPILVACLAARPGSLILLENPEAHVHPRGQSLMGNLAARAAAAGAQVVVETHSDHVLNGIRIAVKQDLLRSGKVVVHFFRRAGNALVPVIVSPRMQPDGMIDDWPDGFFDEWDRSLDELLG